MRVNLAAGSALIDEKGNSSEAHSPVRSPAVSSQQRQPGDIICGYFSQTSEIPSPEPQNTIIQLFSRARMPLLVMNKLTFKSAWCPPGAAAFYGCPGIKQLATNRKKSHSGSLKRGLNSAASTQLALFTGEMPARDHTASEGVDR